MDKKTAFVETVNRLVKLIRVEYGLTQEQMAAAIGISKKTLVETEKGRRKLGWTECAAMASIFAKSQVLQNEVGGDPADLIPAVAFESMKVEYPPTMGGRVFWQQVETKGGYRIQQNYISRHYRLLDSENRRLLSSYDLEELREYLAGILK